MNMFKKQKIFNHKKCMRNTFFASMISIVPVADIVTAAEAQQQSLTTEQQVNDAWLKGKIESAFLFNKHLNPFDIKTDVYKKHVTLSGVVTTEIEKELAEEVAKGIDGVSSVENNLKADNKFDRKKESANNKYLQYMDDVSTTAVVKTKLLMNENVSGLDIDVTTKNNTVILTGITKSKAEKDLAEKLVENTDGVISVVNKIKVQ